MAHWKTANNSGNRRYMYSYDDLNRLTYASYSKWLEHSKFNMNTSYDKNGNIQRLYRRGAIVENPNSKNDSHYGTMDYLNYSYDGNQLTKVTDNGNDNYGFKDGTNTGDDYDYDVNGNMISDANKQITSIAYNHLNLPTEILSNSKMKAVTYIYDATGRKLEKKYSGYGIGTTTTQYADNYIYENNELQFFNTPEGYATPNDNGKFDYIYQYKDHLGNVRLSYTENTDTQDDLVFSNSFENIADWDKSENTFGWALSTIDSNKKKSGNYSGRIDDNYPTNSEKYVNCDIWTAINNTEDTYYTFSAWVFIEDVPENSAQIFLMTRKAGETGYPSGYYHKKSTERGRWVYLEKTALVSSDVKELNFRIDNNKDGTVWFDDVKIVKGNTSKTIIVEESNYYPFGLKHKGYNNIVNGTENKYFTYVGKELSESLDYNMLEMDWRHYDPAIGRFNVIDKLAESFQSHTPYHYSYSNPIVYKDPSGLFSTVVNDDGEVIDHKDDGDTNIYLNSRSGTVVGQEEEGREYKKGDKIFDVDDSNPNYRLFSLINGSLHSVVKSTAVFTIPQSIPVYDDAGKLIGQWVTKIKVPFKALKMVGGILKPVGNGLAVLTVASNAIDYSNGELSGTRFAYRTTGTVASIVATSAIGGPPGIAAGVVIGGTFYAGEMVYDGVKASAADTSDPDNNANTIHSIGEFFRNLGWAIENLGKGLGEGIND